MYYPTSFLCFFFFFVLLFPTAGCFSSSFFASSIHAINGIGTHLRSLAVAICTFPSHVHICRTQIPQHGNYRCSFCSQKSGEMSTNFLNGTFCQCQPSNSSHRHSDCRWSNSSNLRCPQADTRAAIRRRRQLQCNNSFAHCCLPFFWNSEWLEIVATTICLFVIEWLHVAFISRVFICRQRHSIRSSNLIHSIFATFSSQNQFTMLLYFYRFSQNFAKQTICYAKMTFA